MELRDPVLRLSEDVHSAGSFNFTMLSPDWATPGEGHTLPPRILLGNARIEVGVHDGADFQLRGVLRLSGSMTPIPDRDGWFSLALVEVNERGEPIGEDGVRMQGEWDVRSNAHSVHFETVELGPRAYGLCPQAVRLWWERMQLVGQVDRVNVRWSPDDELKIALNVQDVGLTLPIETADFWALYRAGAIEPTKARPRLHLRSGAIQLERDRVVLDSLRGEFLNVASGENVVAIPYDVSMSIEDIPRLDWDDRDRWMEQALEYAPFSMEFRADDFRLQADENEPTPAIELPLAIAHVLERFQLRDWALDTTVTISRDAPQESADGGLVAQPIMTQGQAVIADAGATYQKFPYPLDNVEAHVRFDDERVNIIYLSGEGSDGARVRLSGAIAPPTLHPGVALRIIAHDVPIDDRLRSALQPAEQEVYDALLDDTAFDRLNQAGLLTNQEDIDAAETRRLELRRERAAMNQIDDAEIDPVALQALDDAIAALDRVIAAGPTTFGGVVDLDLTVEREPGRNKRTITTGLVHVQSVGICYERFPYPVKVHEGTISWEQERLTVLDGASEGLVVTTPAGGHGYITGELRLLKRDGRNRAEPDLTLSIVDDVVTDLIPAVVPPTAREAGGSRLGGAVAGSHRRAGRPVVARPRHPRSDRLHRAHRRQ